jgi:hypothetical protein
MKSFSNRVAAMAVILLFASAFSAQAGVVHV